MNIMAFQEKVILRKGFLMQLDYKKLSIGIGLGLLVLALFWQAVAIRTKPQLAVVDMKRLLNQPAVLLSKSQIPEKDQARLLLNYSTVLPQILAAYGNSHRVTVITAPVIRSGTLDITDTIIAQTLEKLKQHD